jgi:hypothetical protein
MTAYSNVDKNGNTTRLLPNKNRKYKHPTQRERRANNKREAEEMRKWIRPRKANTGESINNALNSSEAMDDISGDTQQQRLPLCSVQSDSLGGGMDSFEDFYTDPNEACSEPYFSGQSNIDSHAPVELISYLDKEYQQNWQNQMAFNAEELKEANDKSRKKRADAAKAHLEWWNRVEGLVMEKCKIHFSGSTSDDPKPSPGRFSDSLDSIYCCSSNCNPNCGMEIKWFCITGIYLLY